MTDDELESIAWDRICIGYRATNGEQLRLLALCRRFDGRVVYREGDRMVLEFSAARVVLDEVLQWLPRAGVTHFWRSGASNQPCSRGLMAEAAT